MAFKYTDAVFKAKLPATDKNVLDKLATRANDYGVCWPSVSKTADDAGLGVTATKEALARLIANDLVSIVGKVKSRFGFVNKFKLNLEAIQLLVTQSSYNPVGRRPRRPTVTTQSSNDPAPSRPTATTQSLDGHRIRKGIATEESLNGIHNTVAKLEQEMEELEERRLRLVMDRSDAEDEIFDFLTEEMKKLVASGHLAQADYDSRVRDYSIKMLTEFNGLTYGIALDIIYNILFKDILVYDDTDSVKWPDTNHTSSSMFDEYLKAKPDQTPLQFVERMYAAKAQGLDSLAKMFPETVKFYIGFVT